MNHTGNATVLLLARLGVLATLWGSCGGARAVGIDVDRECARAYGGHFVPVTGKPSAAAARVARPRRGEIHVDPDFHTCVVRATDHRLPPARAFLRNDYSRRQAFNRDNSRFIAYASGGAWHLYDARTLAFLRVLDGPEADAEPQWDPADPHLLYYVPTNGGTKLLQLNVETNATTVAADFRASLPWPGVARVWTHSEGSPSADGRYWCFLAETRDFSPLGAFTYDLRSHSVIGTKALGGRSPDYVSMSPSGRWCVIAGTVAWNPTFTKARRLDTSAQHSDLAIGADGHDYYVHADFSDGYVSMVDIDTGLRTRLVPLYIDDTTTSVHISGKAFGRPGWVLLSTFNHRGGSEKWTQERIMAVEMKANPRIIHLAHHHASYNEYWTQPQASVSRDFSHVLFNSNWGTTSATDVDAYMIRLPDDLIAPAAKRPPAPVRRAAP